MTARRARKDRRSLSSRKSFRRSIPRAPDKYAALSCGIERGRHDMLEKAGGLPAISCAAGAGRRAANLGWRGMKIERTEVRSQMAEPSELFRDACLFQHAICRVPGFDALIHHKSDSCDWAIPDFVITFSFSFKITARFTQNLLQRSRIRSHYIPED